MALKHMTVAVSDSFFTAYSRLPKNQQAKVMNFVNKFRLDPTSSGINYETLKNVKDPRLRSVRIDDDYRGIVCKPPKGNVYLLLWVDKHDAAYQWARNRVCEINPLLGTVQVFCVDETAMSPGNNSDMPEEEPPAGLFDNIRDRELLALGVPEIQLEMTRGIKNDIQLNDMADAFPSNVFTALTWLIQGEPLEEVMSILTECGYEEKETVDTEDFSKALDHPVSRQHFQMDPSEDELTRMFHAPLEKWRVFLHPLQRKLVERDWNGPVRVLGGAGTGKTVVAMHRAAWLAGQLVSLSTEKIFFTTFTRNLAAICEHLEQIRETDDIFRSTCIVARTNHLLDDYENALTEKEIPVYRLTGFDPEDRSQSGVRLATMHRVKGLEFDHVILCGINKGVVPLPTQDFISDDVSVSAMAEARERSLLFETATRAKKTVMVTSYGEKSAYLYS